MFFYEDPLTTFGDQPSTEETIVLAQQFLKCTDLLESTLEQRFQPGGEGWGYSNTKNHYYLSTICSGSFSKT